MKQIQEYKLKQTKHREIRMALYLRRKTKSPSSYLDTRQNGLNKTQEETCSHFQNGSLRLLDAGGLKTLLPDLSVISYMHVNQRINAQCRIKR